MKKNLDIILFRILLILYALIFLYTLYVLLKIYPSFPLGIYMNAAEKIEILKSLTVPWGILTLCMALININVKKLKLRTILFLISNTLLAVIFRLIDINSASYLIPSVWMYFLTASLGFLLDDLVKKYYKPLLITAVVIEVIFYFLIFIGAVLKSFAFVLGLIFLSLPMIILANFILFLDLKIKMFDKPTVILIYFISIICNSYNIFWKVLSSDNINFFANAIIISMILTLGYAIVKKISKWYCNLNKDVV